MTKTPISVTIITLNEADSYERHDWVFSLDADERFTPELADMLKALDLETGSYDGYAIRRRNHIGSRWIRYGGWYPDRITRLYDRRKMAFASVFGHAKVTGGSVGELDADILHFSYACVGQLFGGTNGGLQARDAYQAYQAGRRTGALKPITYGAWAFLWSYFAQGGVLGGIDGLSVSVSKFMRAYKKYAILYEMHHDPQARAHYDTIFAKAYAETRARMSA